MNVIGGAPGALHRCSGVWGSENCSKVTSATRRPFGLESTLQNSPQLPKSRCRCASFGAAEAVP
jgi:hypothetical protein